jgi:ABC-type glycerol-3-phosphate transport system substrate-binding protein
MASNHLKLGRRAEPPSRRPRHSRRALLAAAARLSGAGALPLLVLACGQQPAPQAGTTSAQPVTLAWFAKLKGIAQEDIDAFVRGFVATRPNVTIDLTAIQQTAEGKEKLATYQASGTPVDVVSTVIGIPDLRRMKAAYALNDLIKRDKFDTTQFTANTYREVEIKGKILALPHAYAGNELALVVNKTLFAKAGLPLPSADWKASWTWEQFREAMKHLTSLNGPPPVAGTSRFGTIYDLPPMWGAQWASDDGFRALRRRGGPAGQSRAAHAQPEESHRSLRAAELRTASGGSPGGICRHAGLRCQARSALPDAGER